MRFHIKLLFSLLTSGMLILSFNDKFSFIAWFALIPYFLVISSCTLRWSVFFSWLTGICFFAGITYWFTAYSFVFWFPILGILSLSFIFFGIAFYFVYSKVRFPVLRIMSISSIWAAVEFFRHRTFLAFPWGVLGYSQHNYLQVMQIAKLSGVLGVSILIVLFNLCVAEMLMHFIILKKPVEFSGLFYHSKSKPEYAAEIKEHQDLKAGISLSKSNPPMQMLNSTGTELSNIRMNSVPGTIPEIPGKNTVLSNKKVIIAVMCVAVLVIVNLAGGAIYLALSRDIYSGYGSQKINVALVQPNITFEAKFDTDTDVLIPQKTGADGKYFKAGTELVVFPESVIWGAIEQDRNKSFYTWVKNTAKNEGLHFIMGQILWDEQENYYNAVQLYTPELQILGRYNKMHPLPCAEYMPYPEALGFLRFMNIAKLNITPVKEFVLINYPGKGNIGANICFESTLPLISRTFRKMGADVLFTFTDTAGFKDSLAARYHLVFSQVRAIENNSFMVHSGNNGISAIIDSNGKILAQTSLVKKEVIYGTVYLNANRSFYSRFGELIIYIYFALTFFYLLIYVVQRIRSRKYKNNGATSGFNKAV
jgi:apolipoprotein N-acyltransferase